jgi:predicted nuclease with TOPRIM domain
MAVKFSTDAIQARYAEAVAEKEAILAASKQYRDEYNELAAQADEIRNKQKAASDKFKEIEKDLYDLDMEIGRLIKADPGRAVISMQAEGATIEGKV